MSRRSRLTLFELCSIVLAEDTAGRKFEPAQARRADAGGQSCSGLPNRSDCRFGSASCAVADIGDGHGVSSGCSAASDALALRRRTPVCTFGPVVSNTRLRQTGSSSVFPGVGSGTRPHRDRARAVVGRPAPYRKNMPEETPDSPASLDDSLEERSVGSEIAASTDDLGERPHGETGHDWPGPLEEPPLYPT